MRVWRSLSVCLRASDGSCTCDDGSKSATEAVKRHRKLYVRCVFFFFFLLQASSFYFCLLQSSVEDLPWRAWARWNTPMCPRDKALFRKCCGCLKKKKKRNSTEIRFCLHGKLSSFFFFVSVTVLKRWKTKDYLRMLNLTSPFFSYCK